jgi:CheY-like chemotaxis protein
MEMQKKSTRTTGTDAIKVKGSSLHRILVVEDDEDMRENLQRILAGAGYEVRLARDGADAITFLQSHACDLILTDLIMPRMGGLELLTEIRRQEQNLPVVFLTAFGKPATYAKAMELGAVDFVTKPFRADFLLEVLERILDAGRRGPGGA